MAKKKEPTNAEVYEVLLEEIIKATGGDPSKLPAGQSILIPNSKIRKYFKWIETAFPKIDNNFVYFIMSSIDNIPGTKETLGTHIAEWIDSNWGSHRTRRKGALERQILRTVEESIYLNKPLFPGEVPAARAYFAEALGINLVESLGKGIPDKVKVGIDFQITPARKIYKQFVDDFKKKTGIKLEIARGHLISKSFAVRMAAVLVKKGMPMREFIDMIETQIPVYAQIHRIPKGQEAAVEEALKRFTPVALKDLTVDYKLETNLGTSKDEKAEVDRIKRAWKSGKLDLEALSAAGKREAQKTFWDIIYSYTTHKHGKEQVPKTLEEKFREHVTPKLRIKTGYLRKYTKPAIDYQRLEPGKLYIEVPEQRRKLVEKNMLTYNNDPSGAIFSSFVSNAVEAWWREYWDADSINAAAKLALLQYNYHDSLRLFEGPPEPNIAGV